MKFQANLGNFDKSTSDCLVIGIYENNKLSPTAAKIDKLANGYLSKLLKIQEIPGKIGQTLMLFNIENVPYERVLLVGLGKTETLTVRDFRKTINAIFCSLAPTKAKKADFYLLEVPVESKDLAWKIQQTVLLGNDKLYRFNVYKSEPEPKPTLADIHLIVPSNELNLAKETLTQALAIANGINLTKDVANQPSNVCTPIYVANQAKKLAQQNKKIKINVLDEKEIKNLGMEALIAVGKGSAQPPRLVALEYKGAKGKKAPIALVGKGITFDTGGISIKPADAMYGMKYDMCGAATVLGVFKSVAELKLPINLVGILALAENMPSGTAYKPEDIIKTMSGQTVEVMNTDAEGRLVLADALTYCERFKPDTVIDIATLTGAIVIALGHHVSGVLANTENLSTELINAGNEIHDRVWPLPLWDEYQDQLKSPFADMSNVGGRIAGAITAGCFLSRFAKKFTWAHLDVAGTAAMMGGPGERYATGRPVPLLMQFLLNRCE